MLSSFPWGGQGVIPWIALLARLKERVPWMEKSDVQGGDPCPCTITAVPRSEFASPRSLPVPRRHAVRCWRWLWKLNALGRSSSPVTIWEQSLCWGCHKGWSWAWAVRSARQCRPGHEVGSKPAGHPAKPPSGHCWSPRFWGHTLQLGGTLFSGWRRAPVCTPVQCCLWLCCWSPGGIHVLGSLGKWFFIAGWARLMGSFAK